MYSTLLFRRLDKGVENPNPQLARILVGRGRQQSRNERLVDDDAHFDHFGVALPHPRDPQLATDIECGNPLADFEPG